MSAIANTTDFLRLLREDPEFRAEVRRELQIQELMELPGKFAAFVAETRQEFSEIKARIGRIEDIVAGQRTDIAGLQAAVAGQRIDIAGLQETVAGLQADMVQLQKDVAQLQKEMAKLQETVTRLEAVIIRMEGRIGKLEGAEYERHVSRTFIGDLSNALGGLRRGWLMHSAAYGTTKEFSDLMEDSVDDDKIALGQWHEVSRSDAVVRGVQDGATVYVVVEISLTVHQEDIDRAAGRAAIVQQATGAAAYPVVVGDSIPAPQLAQASDKGVTAIIIQDQRR